MRKFLLIMGIIAYSSILRAQTMEGIGQIYYTPSLGYKYSADDRFPLNDNNQSGSYKYNVGLVSKISLGEAVFLSFGVELGTSGYTLKTKLVDDYGVSSGTIKTNYTFDYLSIPFSFDFFLTSNTLSPYISLGFSNQIYFKYRARYDYSEDYSGSRNEDYKLSGFGEMKDADFNSYVPAVVFGLGAAIFLDDKVMFGVQPYSQVNLKESHNSLWRIKNKHLTLGCRVSLLFSFD